MANNVNFSITKSNPFESSSYLLAIPDRITYTMLHMLKKGCGQLENFVRRCPWTICGGLAKMVGSQLTLPMLKDCSNLKTLGQNFAWIWSCHKFPKLMTFEFCLIAWVVALHVLRCTGHHWGFGWKRWSSQLTLSLGFSHVAEWWCTKSEMRMRQELVYSVLSNLHL